MKEDDIIVTKSKSVRRGDHYSIRLASEASKAKYWAKKNSGKKSKTKRRGVSSGSARAHNVNPPLRITVLGESGTIIKNHPGISPISSDTYQANDDTIRIASGFNSHDTFEVTQPPPEEWKKGQYVLYQSSDTGKWHHARFMGINSLGNVDLDRCENVQRSQICVYEPRVTVAEQIRAQIQALSEACIKMKESNQRTKTWIRTRNSRYHKIIQNLQSKVKSVNAENERLERKRLALPRKRTNDRFGERKRESKTSSHAVNIVKRVRSGTLRSRRRLEKSNWMWIVGVAAGAASAMCIVSFLIPYPRAEIAQSQSPDVSPQIQCDSIVVGSQALNTVVVLPQSLKAIPVEVLWAIAKPSLFSWKR